jgi:hypothetical protein
MLLKLAVGFVDSLEQVGETGRFVHRPKPRKPVTQQLHFALGEQSDGYDPFAGHVSPS